MNEQEQDIEKIEEQVLSDNSKNVKADEQTSKIFDFDWSVFDWKSIIYTCVFSALFVTVCSFLINFSYEKQKETNVRIKKFYGDYAYSDEYDNEWEDFYENCPTIPIWSFEPYLDNQCNELEYNNFDLTTIEETYDIYELAKQYTFNGEYGKEKQLFETNIGLDYSEFSDFLDYLETIYLKPLHNCLLNYQIDRCIFLTTRAFELLQIYNLPLFFAEKTQIRINRILLLRAIFSNADIIMSNREDLFFLFDLIDNNFPQNKLLGVIDRLEKVKENAKLYGIYNYMLGVYYFRDYNYLQAEFFFNNTISNSNALTKNLSYLMIGRCFFRLYDLGELNKKTTLNKLKEVEVKISNPNYRSDINDYKLRIEFGTNMIDSYRENKSSDDYDLYYDTNNPPKKKYLIELIKRLLDEIDE